MRNVNGESYLNVLPAIFPRERTFSGQWKTLPKLEKLQISEKITRLVTVRTEENLQAIRASVNLTPRKTLQVRSEELGISKAMAGYEARSEIISVQSSNKSSFIQNPQEKMGGNVRNVFR